MKQGIHPEYHHDAVVKCACGNTFTTGSVKEELKVDMFPYKKTELSARLLTMILTLQKARKYATF